MYPFIEFYGEQIPLFGICFYWGFGLATLFLAHNLKKMNVDQRYSILISLTGIICGLFGASLFAYIEHNNLLDFERLLLLFKSGKNVFGGVIFSIVAIYMLNKYLLKVSIVDLADSITPPFLIGYSIGRLGCFLAGDGCYGMETDSILGMSFPNGTLPIVQTVYPTPLFDFILLFPAGMILQASFERYRNKNKIFVFGMLYLGFERFAIEFIRRNQTYAGLTQSQWISLALILLAVLTAVKYKPKSKTI
jgi:phosphatidylglycerol:prolipoprotein diacylglycerol transferase